MQNDDDIEARIAAKRAAARAKGGRLLIHPRGEPIPEGCVDGHDDMLLDDDENFRHPPPKPGATVESILANIRRILKESETR